MEWGQLWQILSSCQSVYLFEFIKEPIHIPAIPLEKPSQFFGRDQKLPHRYLIPNRLRLKADVGRKFLDIHHPFFHAQPPKIVILLMLRQEKGSRGQTFVKIFFFVISSK